MIQFFSAVLSTLAIALLVGSSYYLRPTAQVRSAEGAEYTTSTETVICHEINAGGTTSHTAYLVASRRHARIISAHREHGDHIGNASEDVCPDASRVIDLR